MKRYKLIDTCILFDQHFQVVSGVRLDFSPEGVPSPIIDVVYRCWDANASNRPTMAEIARIMSKNCERISSKNRKKESREVCYPPSNRVRKQDSNVSFLKPGCFYGDFSETTIRTTTKTSKN